MALEPTHNANATSAEISQKVAAALATIPPQLAQIAKEISEAKVPEGKVYFLDQSGNKISGGDSKDILAVPEGTKKVVAYGPFNAKDAIGVTRRTTKEHNNEPKLLFDQPITVFAQGTVTAPGSGINSITIASEDVISNNNSPKVHTRGTVITGGSFTTIDKIEGKVFALGKVSATGSGKDSQITAGDDVNLTKDVVRIFGDFKLSPELVVKQNHGDVITGERFLSQVELHGNVTAAKAVKALSLGEGSTVDAPMLYLREGAEKPKSFKGETTFIRSKGFDDFTPTKDIPTTPKNPFAITTDAIQQAKVLCKAYDGCDVATDHSGTTFKFPPINKPQQTKSRE